MTEEKIIIDGIDVSECEYQNYGNCEIDYDEWNGEIIRYNKCQDNPNCHFKQLKRKEQECEEYRKVNDEKNELLALCGITAGGERKRITHVIKELRGELQAKEQECEELHGRTASIIYSLTGGRLSYSTYTLEGCEDAYRDQLRIDVERATKELEEENDILKSEKDKLKYALDEIEEFCKKQNLKYDATACYILGIIGEMKGVL